MLVADIPPYAYMVCAAAVNFGVAIACIIYLRYAVQNMRWSRTYRRFLTAHDQPGLFWTKFVLAIVGALFTAAIGVLILMPHKPTTTFDFFHLPELESGRKS